MDSFLIWAILCFTNYVYGGKECSWKLRILSTESFSTTSTILRIQDNLPLYNLKNLVPKLEISPKHQYVEVS